LFDFVQHAQSVPFPLAQVDPLLFPGVASRPLESGHFYFAQTGHSHFAATFAVGLLDN
jgi:hypothetical protein